MNRRNFLKGIAAASIAVALRPVASLGGPFLPVPKKVVPYAPTRFTIPAGMGGVYLISAYGNGKFIKFKKNGQFNGLVYRVEEEGPLTHSVITVFKEGDTAEIEVHQENRSLELPKVLCNIQRLS